ncbi:MAG TPA: RICIN domain-containing protein [Clostridium sp.]|nr:RICIN domain-containing protein [Clostridium sp.]
MKARLLTLLTALCIMLSLLPVSAEEAPVITIITQPASLTEVTQGEVSGKLFETASASVKDPTPVITITKQPEKITTVYQKLEKAELTVEANLSNNGFLKYQWYSNTTNSNIGGTPVTAASRSSFTTPRYMEVGTYYYYCVITSSDAEPVRSEVATVIVEPEPADIKIIRQPEETVSLIKGNTDWTLWVIAYASSNAELTYQWYSNTVCDSNSGTPILGATKEKFMIPADLDGGTYYYYCELSAPGAEPVYTDVTTVNVKVKESRNAPPAPTLESKTSDSITLVYNNLDIEFSMDGKNWGGPIFRGLTPYTTYTIYARYKDTYTHYASPASEPLMVRTSKRAVDKGEQTAPSAPELLSKTGRSVTLKPIEGAEYRRDGEVWQDSNTFYNLSFSTTYKFYARMKQTDELKASPESSPLKVITEVSGGFPFVPSNKNMTNGIIKSGWAYIYTRDYGSIAPSNGGVVSPTRSFPLYYFEHLGDNKYYIHTANGGYLSYLGPLKSNATIIISDKPCEWKIYGQNAGGYIEYNFNVASDTTYYLKLWGGDGEETTDSNVALVKDKANRFQRDGAQLTIRTQVADEDIPQWWKEYKKGKTEPTYDVVEIITYEAANSKKPTDGQGTSEGISSGEIVPVTANPSQTRFVMNGKPVSVTAAYNIKNTNYLQLRAIASMLNGTAAQFDVGWDGQYAVIEPGRPYSGTVTATRLQSTTNVRNSDTKFKMNGEVFSFSDARLIDGDTNYIQLREFAQKLSGTASQFNVYWDSHAGQAVIQPGLTYTGWPQIIETSDDTDSSSEESEKEVYYIKASKNKNFVIDVSDASEDDGAKLNLHTKTGNDNQKFRLIKMDGDVYVIQCVHSGKWWTSSGKKGAVLNQSVSVTDGSSITFRIIKQANGTYRIMDSAGLYVGVSDAKMGNGANIILWTEASDESQTFILERIE